MNVVLLILFLKKENFTNQKITKKLLHFLKDIYEIEYTFFSRNKYVLKLKINTYNFEIEEIGD